MSMKLAIAALALGLLSPLHLFGLEKAVLALALGAAALKDPQLGTAGRRIAQVAVASGLIYAFWVAGVMFLHMPKLSEAAAKLAR